MGSMVTKAADVQGSDKTCWGSSVLFFFFFYPWDEILLRGSLFMLSCSELGSEVMQVKCFLFSV